MVTDAKIIKAWEQCVYPTDSIGQKLYPFTVKCSRVLAENVLDLINRLQEQNAALIAGQETLQKCIAERHKEITRLQGIILAFMDEVAKMEDDGVDVSKIPLISICDEGRNAIDRYSALAIKEFAERLKAKAETHFYSDVEFGEWTETTVDVEDIDIILKEMIGEQQ